MEDVVRDVYEELGDLLDAGDDVFVEEGPALVQDVMEDPVFQDALEAEPASLGEYTRAEVVGDPGEHVLRYMEWAPGYALMPHEHNGRPCFEVLDDGYLVVVDYDREHREDDLYQLAPRASPVVEPGDSCVVDPREGEIHAVYSPVRSRSLHVYPEDAYTCHGYVAVEDVEGENVFRREEFELRPDE